MKTNENKTLEQLKAELEQAQQAFDVAKKLAEQKEKEETERKKAELAAEKNKRKEEIKEAENHYRALVKQFIKDYGSYDATYSYNEEDDNILNFIFGSNPWRFFL